MSLASEIKLEELRARQRFVTARIAVPETGDDPITEIESTVMVRTMQRIFR
jgi:hypothetical protein